MQSAIFKSKQITFDKGTAPKRLVQLFRPVEVIWVNGILTCGGSAVISRTV
jgi:hypothetical protein